MLYLVARAMVVVSSLVVVVGLFVNTPAVASGSGYTTPLAPAGTATVAQSRRNAPALHQRQASPSCQVPRFRARCLRRKYMRA